MKRLFILLLLISGDALYGQSIETILNKPGSDRQKADTLFFYARKYFMSAKFDSAATYLDKGLVFAININDDELLAKYYIEQSSLASFSGDNKKSLVIIRKAVPHLDRIKSYDLHNKYLLLTGKYYNAVTKNDSALHYFQLCEKLNNTENPYRNWLVYVELGLLFQYAESPVEAEKYFKKAYEITRSKGIRMDHGVVLDQFADFYFQAGRPEQFAAILNEHQELMKGAKKDYSRDPVHSMLFMDWTKTPLAQKVEFMTNVKNTLLKGGFITNAGLANNYIALFYEENGQYNEAVKYLLENQELSALEKNVNNIYINTKALYRLLKKAGRKDEAFIVADRLLVLKDSIIKIQQRGLTLELDTKYQTAQKEKEISVLNSQNELNKIRILHEVEKSEGLQRENNLKEEKFFKELQLRMALERENILVDSSLAQQERLTLASVREKDLKNRELEKEKQMSRLLANENELKQALLNDDKKRNRMLWAGIGLLLVATAIILWQYRRQFNKNSIIEKQRLELEVLNREIHHRVKNNLQVISSLLDLQSQTIDDEKTAEKFHEGSQRVQSMAFIHQNLYQGENIGRIDIRQYIRMLTDNLLQSYNADTDKIRLTTQIDELNLHSDTVIPLGMIINELVSNSLKYAFTNKQGGQIEVVLKQLDEKILLQVKDNGVGMKDTDITTVNSFGYKIIKAFTQKLKALLTINNQHGTDVQLLISKYRTA
jgi:two-component sensor histidine kinase